MTDRWDFYPLRVDDQPASIFLDLGVHKEAPVPSLPYMAYVRLYMRQPRADGLSSSDEFDVLVAVEETLENSLCSDSVQYVGRNTSSGCRDFYFYIASPDTWEALVTSALSPFRDYSYDVGFRVDAEWSTYFEFLYPGPLDRQCIENRHVCEALERHGDKLIVAREIDHWSYFPDETSADAYLNEVEALGFQTREKLPADAERPEFGARVWRMDVPSFQQIDEVTLPLFKAASQHGGYYDGWECRVEA